MQLRSFDATTASHESWVQPATPAGLRAHARLGPLGATWRDWLLIAQVAFVILAGLWLVAGGSITFGQPPG